MGCCLPNQRDEIQTALPTCYTEAFEGEEQGELLVKASLFVKRCEGRLEAKYRLGRRIGRGEMHTGTFGKVFEATHLASGTRRAVKIVDLDLVPEALFGGSPREVEILQTLVAARQDHPNIVKVFEVIFETETMNIAFELLTGGELLKRLQEAGPFSEDKSSEYMRQILSGVAYCHSKQYMHRDLKPENIVFETNSPDSMIKIVDFGTSKEIHGRENACPAVGTKIYIAPEVICGKYDEKCDIWSCGVIAYLLLTADLPGNWGSCTMEEKVLTRKMDLSRVSAKAKSFVMKTLSFDPSQRPSAGELLGHPWLQRSKTSYTCPETETIQRLTHFHVFGN